MPPGAAVFDDGGKDPLYGTSRISHDREVRPLDLVDLRVIDIHVMIEAFEQKALTAPRGPVVKAHAQGQHEVRLVENEICRRRSVHAEHAQVKRVVRRKRAEPHQGEGHRYAVLPCQPEEGLLAPRRDDPTPA